jgi:hypothetical protein
MSQQLGTSTLDVSLIITNYLQISNNLRVLISLKSDFSGSSDTTQE